jgi:AcrR family transcriptional regulator
MGSPARNYHHGDLRGSVLMAGLAQLDGDATADLGLRALARDVGVSATALYRHFPDKEALLDALAEEGLKQLGVRQGAAWDAAGGGRKGFVATGIAYVRFAHDHPGLFRLTFTRRMPGRTPSDSGEEQSVAYRLLRRGVAEVLPAIENQEAAALHAWSLVHGLAMLVLDGSIIWDERKIAEVVDLTFNPPV